MSNFPISFYNLLQTLHDPLYYDNIAYYFDLSTVKCNQYDSNDIRDDNNNNIDEDVSYEEVLTSTGKH